MVVQLVAVPFMVGCTTLPLYYQFPTALTQNQGRKRYPHRRVVTQRYHWFLLDTKGHEVHFIMVESDPRGQHAVLK